MFMKDISYEILDLFKTYGSTREGMDQALDQDERPQVLHALSPIRENLLEWLDLTGQDQVLELGSGYGVFTGDVYKRQQGDLPSFLGLYIGTYLACQYQDDPKAFLGSAVYEAAGGIAAYMGAGYEVGFLALVKIIPEGIIVL